MHKAEVVDLSHVTVEMDYYDLYKAYQTAYKAWKERADSDNCRNDNVDTYRVTLVLDMQSCTMSDFGANVTCKFMFTVAYEEKQPCQQTT